MEDVERLLKGTVEELNRLLNAKNVLGEPIERDGSTIVPMVSYGFGFGAGGTDNQKNGPSGGTGAGGGIKPIGAIVIDKNGARVEGFKGAMTGLIEVVGEAAAQALSRRADRKDAERESRDKKSEKS